MRVSKHVLIILPILFLWGCNEDSPTGFSDVNPEGSWTYTESATEYGLPGQIKVTCNVSSNNTYKREGSWVNGTTNITVYTEQGIWSVSGKNVTFYPSSCKELDDTSLSLFDTDCDYDQKNFAVNGTSMTDGTITLTKK